MNRCPRTASTTLLMTLLLGLTQSGPPAFASTLAPVVVEGQLRDHGGRPAAGSVLLNLIDLRAGSSATPLLAMGTSGSNGRFRLRLEQTPELAAIAAGNDGFLNMRLLAVTDGAKGIAMFTRQWNGLGWTSGHGSREIVVRAAAALSQAQRTNLARLRSSASAAEARTGAGRASVDVTVAGLQGSASIGSDNPYCYRVNDEFRTAYTVIGELHTWRDMTATFGYGTSADSDISAGFSFDSGRTWTLAGQLHVGNSTSTRSTKTVDDDYYGRTIRSQFEYVKYHHAGTFCYDDAVYQSPWRWTGGGIIAGSSQTQFDGKCGRTYPKYYLFGRNTSWSRSASDFRNWSAAASVFGMGVRAQSGASTSADLTYTFGSETAYHRICGSDDYPARATRVFAGP